MIGRSLTGVGTSWGVVAVSLAVGSRRHVDFSNSHKQTIWMRPRNYEKDLLWILEFAGVKVSRLRVRGSDVESRQRRHHAGSNKSARAPVATFNFKYEVLNTREFPAKAASMEPRCHAEK